MCCGRVQNIVAYTRANFMKKLQVLLEDHYNLKSLDNNGEIGLCARQ